MGVLMLLPLLWLGSFSTVLGVATHQCSRADVLLQAPPPRPDHELMLDEIWHDFKSAFNKSYAAAAEEQLRRVAWENNLMKVHVHNQEAAAGLHNFTLRENQLADLTLKEYIREMIRLLGSRRRRCDNSEMLMLANSPTIPDELDWRQKGFVTPAMNQEDCGACYAFSIGTLIQAQIFKATGQLVPLSDKSNENVVSKKQLGTVHAPGNVALRDHPSHKMLEEKNKGNSNRIPSKLKDKGFAQQIVDCSVRTGNLGCRGGSLRNTMRYVHESGLAKSSDYPYTSEQSVCRYLLKPDAVRISDWRVLPPRDEQALKLAVATIGPIAVSINASPHTFMLYHNGIYHDADCSSDTVNHAMLLVGYTRDAWILKNWWSEHWGINGYMYLRRGQNLCGVANFAAYAIL